MPSSNDINKPKDLLMLQRAGGIKTYIGAKTVLGLGPCPITRIGAGFSLRLPEYDGYNTTNII
jgi:hypothetical protein